MDMLIKAIEACSLCNEKEDNTVPLHGEGNTSARIVFVSETPPEYAQYTKSMLSGPAGKVLEELISLSSLDKADIYITSLLKCTLLVPGKRVHFNISKCYPFLISQLRKIKPEIICPLGNTVLGIMTGNILSLKEHRGKAIRYEGYIYFPLSHPAEAYYDYNTRYKMETDMIALGKLYQSIIHQDFKSDNILNAKANNNI